MEMEGLIDKFIEMYIFLLRSFVNQLRGFSINKVHLLSRSLMATQLFLQLNYVAILLEEVLGFNLPIIRHQYIFQFSRSNIEK